MWGAGVGEGEGVVGWGEGFCEGLVEGTGFDVEEGGGLCEACDCSSLGSSIVGIEGQKIGRESLMR